MSIFIFCVGRVAPGIATVENWLVACGGDLTKSCKILDMNAVVPTWSTFVNLPYVSRHPVFESYGGRNDPTFFLVSRSERSRDSRSPNVRSSVCHKR